MNFPDSEPGIQIKTPSFDDIMERVSIEEDFGPFDSMEDFDGKYINLLKEENNQDFGLEETTFNINVTFSDAEQKNNSNNLEQESFETSSNENESHDQPNNVPTDTNKPRGQQIVRLFDHKSIGEQPDQLKRVYR